jgi:hypothetical protein
MARVSAFQAVTRTAFVLGLCLLAFSFAMEAKLVLYGLADGSDTGIAAARALLTDLPEVDALSVPAPAPVQSKTLFAILAAWTAVCLWKADGWLGGDVLCKHRSVVFARCLSPNHFFRPPPVL